jgi:hypothetical protein
VELFLLVVRWVEPAVSGVPDVGYYRVIHYDIGALQGGSAEPGRPEVELGV